MAGNVGTAFSWTILLTWSVLNPNARAAAWRDGKAPAASSVTFVSQAALYSGLKDKLGLSRLLLPVRNTRSGINKESMIHNSALPKIEVDAETYEVRADGELLTCAPAESLPRARRYFLF